MEVLRQGVGIFPGCEEAEGRKSSWDRGQEGREDNGVIHCEVSQARECRGGERCFAEGELGEVEGREARGEEGEERVVKGASSGVSWRERE